MSKKKVIIVEVIEEVVDGSFEDDNKKVTIQEDGRASIELKR